MRQAWLASHSPTFDGSAASGPRRPGNVACDADGEPRSTGGPSSGASELRQLQAAFDAALSGAGSLAMVVGEPGIGKTSLCEQLATYVACAAARALVGHCYEEGSLSLPYLPFVEAHAQLRAGPEPEALRRDLGSGAGDVARIVSEVRERVPVEPRHRRAIPRRTAGACCRR